MEGPSAKSGKAKREKWEDTGTIATEGGRPKGTGNTPMATLAINLKTEEEVVRAFRHKTGERKWECKMNDITWTGVLTTASDLLFSGGREGYFFALDDRTSQLFWKAAVGGQVTAGRCRTW
jgi:glucose dehydrogenase